MNLTISAGAGPGELHCVRDGRPHAHVGQQTFVRLIRYGGGGIAPVMRAQAKARMGAKSVEVVEVAPKSVAEAKRALCRHPHEAASTSGLGRMRTIQVHCPVNGGA